MTNHDPADLLERSTEHIPIGTPPVAGGCWSEPTVCDGVGAPGAGLQAEVLTERRPGSKPGFVLGVNPGPGTVLEPGDVVTMTETAEPRGPADEVHVEINSIGPGDSMDYLGLNDRQIRAGATIRIDLGATIWVYGDGKPVTLGTVTVVVR